MSVAQINNIEDLIQLNDRKIIKHEVSRLTAPGDNYGSLILNVILTLQTADGTEQLHTVIKMVPPNAYLQEVFNTSLTFRNEIAFYGKIVPLLQNFQRENGIERVIDFAPNYYGGRLNLEGDRVDENAALVLENMKIANYVTLERTQGLDLETTKLVLENLAQLHAVAATFRLKNPGIFEKEIKPYLLKLVMTDELRQRRSSEKDVLGKVVDQIEVLKRMKNRILTGFEKQLQPCEPREPYATIVHNDCWTNNFMVKFEDGKVMKSKLVDFQLCKFASAAQDLVFFLFTSVRNDIVEESYRELLRYYHVKFTEIVKELKCDVEVFTFEALEREMDHEGVLQFGQVAFMLIPIYAVRKHVTSIEDFTPDSMGDIAQTVSDLHKQKLIFVVREFIKRNWV